MSLSTTALERQVRAERAAFADTLNELGNRTRAMRDWRSHVSRHPIGALGVAVTVGVVAGLATSSKARRDGNDQTSAPQPVSGEWERVIATVVGIVGTRAVQLAGGFLRDALLGPPRDPDRAEERTDP